MTLLAIDPGNIESGYCIVDTDTLKPLEHGKIENDDLLTRIGEMRFEMFTEVRTPHILAIERVASYGMAVGREVFETCEWTGRFIQEFLHGVHDGDPLYIYRRDEKLHICGDSKAKDANIRRALIDRFAQHDLKNGKGTKKTRIGSMDFPKTNGRHTPSL